MKRLGPRVAGVRGLIYAPPLIYAAAANPAPAQVNSEPFTGGWMMKVKVGSKDLPGLLDAAAYKEHCDAGGH